MLQEKVAWMRIKGILREHQEFEQGATLMSWVPISRIPHLSDFFFKLINGVNNIYLLQQG